MAGADRRPGAEEKAPKLDPFSMAFKAKKEQLYDRVKLSVGQLNIIIYIAAGALAVVILLILLEAAGLFRL